MVQGPLYRDTIAGGIAGLIGGLVFWLTLQGQGMAGGVPGLLGVNLSPLGTLLHLLVSILLGAGFGAISRYHPLGYAALVTTGLLYGMLWWIVGPVTLGTLIEGQVPTWTLDEAGSSFTSLVGHLFYGGLTGLGFYALLTVYLRLRPEPEPDEAPSWKPSQRVVILGGGFGGVSAAQRLERLFWRDPGLEVALVSQSNYLLFTPMLAGVATSALEAQHISAPVRAACPYTRFLHGEVNRIDTASQTVWVSTGPSRRVEELKYDHLVLALGSVPNFYNLPGLEEHAFTLKSLEDASVLRNHVIEMLERADVELDAAARRRQLTFVVAGGGFAGVETVAELFDMVHSVLHYYPSIRPGDLRFALVHSRDRILPELSQDLGGYALRRLQRRGIEFILGARVSGCTPEAVLLSDGGSVETHTLVWTAGNQPNPVLRTLGTELNRAGAVVADSTLRARESSNLWAIGDCAQIPDPDNEGRFYPPTAQHATRQGKTVADNIAASIRGKPLKTFHFHSLGLLVNLGRLTGAAEIRGVRFSGLLAWFMWRATYLSKLPGLEKKVRVVLDWTLDLLFPRDIVLTSSADMSTKISGTASSGRTADLPGAEPVRPAEPEQKATGEGDE